jgi:hypothetical protein
MFKARSASLIVGVWLSVGVVSAQRAASFGPILELEKPVYVAGEAVRFWIGVTSDVPIPEALQSTYVLHWVLPDGSRTDESVSSTADGDPSRSWQGGWGFGTRTPSVGRYVVSFEFAGQKTADQTFEVIPNPFAGRIEAHWIFVHTKSGGDVHSRGVLLHIENRTGRVLHFGKPGLSGSEVWVHVKQFQPPSSDHTFIPSSALLQADEIPSFSLDRLDWRNQSRWPMIAVPIDGSVDRNLVLDAAYPFRGGQEYEVTLSTVLTVFVGERDDADAQLFPLRIPVSESVRFRW